MAVRPVMAHNEPTRIPGNEPDAGDMSTEPGIGLPDGSNDHSLPDDEAENLGGFA